MSNKIRLFIIVGFLVLAGCNKEYQISQHTIEVHFTNGDVDTITTQWKMSNKDVWLFKNCLSVGNSTVANDVRYFKIINTETKTKHE